MRTGSLTRWFKGTVAAKVLATGRKAKWSRHAGRDWGVGVPTRRGRRRLVLAIAAAAAISIPTAPVGAQVPPLGPPVTPPSLTPPAQIGTLGPGSPVLVFSGAIDNPTPFPLVAPPMPVVCAVECREWRFNAPRPDPFLVSVKNTVTGAGGTFNANDGFDLFVYGPAGTLVGAATGIGSNGQAITVSTPEPGAYTIVVSLTYAEDANAAYRGEVRLMSGSSWHAAPATCNITAGGSTGCFDLPVLRALPAYDLAVSGLPPVASTPLGFPFPATVPTSQSCYLDESVGLDSPSLNSLANPTLRCLRFTSDVQNVGAGTLEVRLPWLAAGGANATPTSGFLPGGCQAQQVLTTPTGGLVTRPAGACEFHPAHAHFHYKDLVSFTLYDVSAGGGIGPRVVSSLKESFCLSDDDYFGFSTAGPNGPRNFVGQPGCNVPSDIELPPATSAPARAGGAYVVEGISPGWGDVYTWDTPDQYIDITNVVAGTYNLVEETNPNGTLVVAGPARTCSLTELQLTATSVRSLATQASIPCP